MSEASPSNMRKRNHDYALALRRCIRLMNNDHITAITDATFDSEVLQSDVPVLVDYWAETCGPCKALSAVLDELAPEYEGRVKIVSVDIGTNPNSAARFGVRALPTLMVFKNGSVDKTSQGAMSRSQLSDLLDKAV